MNTDHLLVVHQFFSPTRGITGAHGGGGRGYSDSAVHIYTLAGHDQHLMLLHDNMHTQTNYSHNNTDHLATTQSTPPSHRLLHNHTDYYTDYPTITQTTPPPRRLPTTTQITLT